MTRSLWLPEFLYSCIIKMYRDIKSIQWTVVLDESPKQGDTLCRNQAGQVWILLCQIWTGTSQLFRAQSSLSKWTLKVVDAQSWQRRHFTFEDHSVSLLYPKWASVNAYSLCPDMPCSSFKSLPTAPAYAISTTAQQTLLYIPGWFLKLTL